MPRSVQPGVVHSHPVSLEAAKAAEILRAKVGHAPGLTLTTADAAARSGLALRDAESALKWLSSEYRGQLRVTADGDLVHVFPTGFTKPWETPDALREGLAKIGHGLVGALRFVVRAWVAIVLVGYVAIFLAMILAMAFARQGDSNSRSDRGVGGGAIAFGLLRILGDALFWTFHPWSPFAVGYGSGYGGAWDAAHADRRRRQADDGPKVPLYEHVNRFFFGPTVPAEDPLEGERRVIAAIRAGKGRIGLADVMRTTGLPRAKADPLMARLMLDYEGDVQVSEDGGIFYTFAALRRTASASDATEREPSPAWAQSKPVPPLTGNGQGANLAIVAINLFNLVMGAWSIQNNMTIERVSHLFDRVPHPVLDTGLPIVLGVIPLVFSALLFLLPLGRALARPARVRAAANERGRLAVLRDVIEGVRAKRPVTDASAARAWLGAAGEAPASKQLDRELVALGGDVVIEDSGKTRWRFPDLETEAAAVEAEREAAAEEEARLGDIVYATDEAPRRPS